MSRNRRNRELSPDDRQRLIEMSLSRSRPVIRLSDGERFPSVVAAAADVGALKSSIVQAIKRGGTCRGHRWRYEAVD